MVFLENCVSTKITTLPLEHTPGNPPWPTMKGIPLYPVGKGLGVCSKGVVKQP